jgi:hypothetical protein
VIAINACLYSTDRIDTGTKCPLCIFAWSDGRKVYFCVNHEARKPYTKSSARDILTYLQTGHNHDLIPDVMLIKNVALARGVPPLAVEEITNMRATGMAIKDIHKAVTVTSTLFSSHNLVTIDGWLMTLCA